MKRRPNEPVPPGTRITLPSRSRSCGANRPKGRSPGAPVATIWTAPRKDSSNHVGPHSAAMRRRQTLGRPGARLLRGRILVNCPGSATDTQGLIDGASGSCEIGRLAQVALTGEAFMSLRIGDVAPGFEADTPQGRIRLLSWLGDSW